MRSLILAAGLALAVATPALAADPVEGEWLNQDKSGTVRIAACPDRADRMCGTIASVKDKTRTQDTNNPDPALRSRPLVGLPIIRDFKQAAPGRWMGGKIYDPQTGKTYDSKISINANGSLSVAGCILFVCQTQTWTRS
jgi:uncharacterized protein (DUF2147 family)